MLKCGQTGRHKYCFGGFPEDSNIEDKKVAKIILCPKCRCKCNLDNIYCSQCGQKIKE